MGLVRVGALATRAYAGADRGCRCARSTDGRFDASMQRAIAWLFEVVQLRGKLPDTLIRARDRLPDVFQVRGHRIDTRAQGTEVRVVFVDHALQRVHQVSFAF